MVQPDLDIGVIYTHERELMPQLLDTMGASGPDLQMRLILVDNASEDGAAQWGKHFPNTKIVRNEQKLPYAANLNRILDTSTARYTLLMNTDMYFMPENQCLSRMVDFMDREPDCGLAGCRLYHADGSDAFAARRFQTLPLILARRCGLSRVLHRTVADHFYKNRPLSDSWPCDWLSGCFLMVRREAIEEVGQIDESYGKYFEDVDICLRIARAGWRVMYHGEASCVHLEQRASKRLLSSDAWLHFRAYLHWLKKWGYLPDCKGLERRAA